MDEKYIGAVYSMLAEKGRVLPKFPVEYVRKGLPDENLKVRSRQIVYICRRLFALK